VTNTKGAFSFHIFLLLISILGIWQSITFKYFDAMLLPLLSFITIFVMSIFELALKHRRKAKPPTTKDREQLKIKAKSELSKLIVLFGWVGGFIIAIYLIGFKISMFLFILSYLKVQGRNWVITLIYAIIVTGLTYCLFELVMKLKLYNGIIFSL